MAADASTKKQFEVAFKEKNYADQIRLGKQILSSEPDNAAVCIVLGVAGLGNPSFLADSASYARKAIELIDAVGG